MKNYTNHSSLSCFYFFILFILPIQLFGSHVFGGELEAVCTGNNVYQFKLTEYIECGAVHIMPAYDSLDVYDKNSALVKRVYLSMSVKDTIPVLQNLCASNPASTCIARVVYTGTSTLNPITGGYTIAFGDCCRSSRVQNIYGASGSGQVYVIKLPGSELVNVCNSSPVFNSFPPSEICTNISMDIDFSATDLDGDVLKYKLVTPYSGYDEGTNVMSTVPPISTVNFSPPYSAADPLNCGLIIDQNTGHISGVPKKIGMFVIGVLVEEYRNGVLIGSKIRDFSYTVVACAPLLSSSSKSITACNNTAAQLDYSFNGKLKHGSIPTWNFGDPASGVNNTSTIKNATHLYSNPGTYFATISLLDTCLNILKDTIKVTVSMCA